MAAAIPPAGVINTLEDLLTACGVPNDGLFNGATNANRIAHDIFNNDFNSCMDVTFDDFDQECKTYSSLTINQGQIRLRPGTKNNIKAMMQWCREKLLIGEDPAMIIYPNNDQLGLIRRYKQHQQFKDKSKTISDLAKPEKLKDDTKWIDWAPSFSNFIKSIPGINGVSLNYIIRDSDEPADEDDNTLNFLDNLALCAPLQGENYQANNAEVHTYLIHFVSGNSVAEAKIIAHGRTNDGRAHWKALKHHFEGVGVHSLEITKAENIINNLFYSGEKKPHMWWSEFEKEISRAFAVYCRVEGRDVYSNDMKLRILMSKIQADFLQHTKAALNVEMSKTPMMLTYEDAMTTFRNAVNLKHPPSVGSGAKVVRRINKVSQYNNQGGGKYNRVRNRSRDRGRGRGNRHFENQNRNYNNKGSNNNTNINDTKPYYINGSNRSNDTWMAVASNGKAIECHYKTSYPGDIWRAG